MKAALLFLMQEWQVVNRARATSQLFSLTFIPQLNNALCGWLNLKCHHVPVVHLNVTRDEMVTDAQSAPMLSILSLSPETPKSVLY